MFCPFRKTPKIPTPTCVAGFWLPEGVGVGVGVGAGVGWVIGIVVVVVVVELGVVVLLLPQDSERSVVARNKGTRNRKVSSIRTWCPEKMNRGF